MPEAKIQEKRWSKELEEPLYKAWREKGLYAFDKNSDKPTYSIDTPPPYVNSPIHIGHATTYVLMDMFARYRRMTGHSILFPLGLDRNGLPIEMAAEKKFKVKLTDLDRADALEKCESILAEASDESKDSFMKLGISFNSFDEGTGIGEVYHTDSDDYRSLTQDTFIDLWKKGLIYEDERLNSFCTGCKTTLAASELQRKEVKTTLNDIEFTVKETGEKVIISTTRPELMCTAGMMIFNPEDDRYKHLEGKTAITPLYDTEIPIRGHTLVDPEFGTGIEFMSLSAGDQETIRFLIEMELEAVGCIDIHGNMMENAKFTTGMSVKEARAKMIELYDEKGFLKGQTEIMHSVPICERSGDEIQFIAMPEYYCKQVEFKDKMKEFAQKMNFHSPRSRQIMLDWIDSVKIDWPISRRRYYATEVPLWYSEDKTLTALPQKGGYLKPWKDLVPQDAEVYDENRELKGTVKDFPDVNWVGETRVFDTWFDSSISPLYILKWTRDDAFFDKSTPCSLRPQGKEIIRTWLYYTVLKDYHLTGECIFKDVWINYHIVDEKGHKMSKSKGNVIDPHDILEKFGAEPFRLWAAIEGNLDSTDFKCSYERIEGATKTITKLWNVARFISMFPEPEGEVELTEVDKWIREEVHELIRFAKESYEKYDFHNPATKLKHFIWETLASHYLEMVKNRAYNDNDQYSKAQQNGAILTLNYCLDNILKLLAPVIPFATGRLYEELRGEDIHFTSFPSVEEEHKVAFTTADIVDVNSRIWKFKEENKISLRDPVKEVVLPEKLKSLEADLKAMHKIENIVYKDEVEIKQ